MRTLVSVSRLAYPTFRRPYRRPFPPRRAQEKVIVNRERASGAYGMFPYLLAKLAAELPVGAFFPLAFGAVVYPMAGCVPYTGPHTTALAW